MMLYIAYLIMVWFLIGVVYLFHSFIMFEVVKYSPLIMRIIIVSSLIVALIIRIFYGEVVHEGGLI